MEGKRFDALTRTLADARSRRAVLRALAGGAAGGLLALVGRREAGAYVCRQPGATCLKDAHCCSNTCYTDTHRCACQFYKEVVCGRQCVDLSSDASNCGECGHVCPDGQSCSHSICQESAGLAAPPEAVWRTLTNAATLAELGLATDFAPRVGHRFQLRVAPWAGFDGVVTGEVVAVDAPHRLVFTWSGGPLVHPATAVLVLEPLAGGTRTHVSLTHERGGDAACRAATLIMGRQWQRTLFGQALPRYMRTRE